MKTNDVRKLPPTERFLYWVREREAVRLRKEAGEPRPWTDDEILNTYRFCNVRRMDDRVSRWLLEHWYSLDGVFGPADRMLVGAALARHFNNEATLASIRGLVFGRAAPAWDEVKRVVRALKESGVKVFSPAYMVRGIGEVDKTEMVVERVTKPLYLNPPRLDTTSMQRSVEALLPYWGFSTFMAGQVVADLRWVLEGTWADRDRWAPVGPGSARGLARLLHGERWKEAARGYVSHPANWLIMFREHVLGDQVKNIATALTSRMEAMDWQNCLCEWDKYERALWGEGKPKQLYRERS